MMERERIGFISRPFLSPTGVRNFAILWVGV